MASRNENEHSVIPISITTKVVIGEIEKMFNKAFNLINSANREHENANHYLMFQLHKKYYNTGRFRFNAIDDSHYKEAIELFDSVIALKPDHKFSFLYKGIALSKIKLYNEATEAYSKAIEINPLYNKAYNNRGMAKGQLKDYQGAIEDYSKAIEIEPLYYKAYLNRGIAEAQLKGL